MGYKSIYRFFLSSIKFIEEITFFRIYFKQSLEQVLKTMLITFIDRVWVWVYIPKPRPKNPNLLGFENVLKYFFLHLNT